MPESNLLNVKGMVLAAGFGTRLLPITHVIPKALLPIEGRSLLEWNLRHLAESGVREGVVNAHHLALMIVRWIEERMGDPSLPVIRVSVEPRILGTAGGIANAAARLDSDPVLILNSDQIFRPDLARAVAFHRSGRFIATLLCVRDPSHRQIGRDGDRVSRIIPSPSRNDPTLLTFTGVYLLSQEAIARIPRDGYAEMTPLFRAWAAEGRLGCLACEEPFVDAGDAEGYLETALARGGGSISQDAVVSSEARVEESVVLAGAIVEAGSRVSRSILGPGAIVKGECDRRILAAGESRRLSLLSREEEVEVGAYFEPPPERIRLLAGDGSPRRFSRVFLREGTRLILQAPPDKTPPASIYPRRAAGPDENESYAYVAGYLRRSGVRVPSIDRADFPRGILILEDLGDETLFRKLSRPGMSDQDRLELLQEAVDLLVRMQGAAQPFDMNEVGALPYDVAFILEYEAGYFHREMVRGLAEIGIDFEEMAGEYGRAARAALDGAPRRFMHRDYQSRNLMSTGAGLALIDLQGARLGPPEYDLASLLLDPYANLPAGIRDHLLDRYLDRNLDRPLDPQATDSIGGREAIRSRYRFCGINRMMQALGAYAYLGGRLGKPGFLEFAPVALARLRELADGELPKLADLARRIEGRRGAGERAH
jgi:NDP-sugar pyrophosphorylase family protein/aminoglycoside/choline kinase family phosphotransferase